MHSGIKFVIPSYITTLQGPGTKVYKSYADTFKELFDGHISERINDSIF